MPDKVSLIATTAFGLEAIAKRELAALGYEGQVRSPGRIHFTGDLSAIMQTNLWLRTVDRVLICVSSFPAPDFEALFEQTKAADWARWMGRDAAFPVIGRSLKSQLTSVPACQRAVKKAIVESLYTAHQTTSLPEDGPLYRVEIALLDDQATLTIDTTGPSLHKRGYRRMAADAPLKETLAAAMVQLSFWNTERSLVDPFCGSGTIPIEAALIGLNRAPGLVRSFAAESWPHLGPADWHAARQEAISREREPFELRIIGTDIDDRALRFARHNAELAGCSDLIHFQQLPFSQLTSKREYGCVITNPPYGRRIGDSELLESLYLSIPLVLRKLPTWSHFILTAYPAFESLLGRQANRRRKLYNGRIECTYFQFHGPSPSQRLTRQPACDQSPENPAGTTTTDDAPCHNTDNASGRDETEHAAGNRPVFGGITDKMREQAELFRSRLRKRMRHLRRWPTRRGVTCYRLYDRDIPEIPLVVDRYEDHLHLTEYERPHDRDAAQHADWLDLMTRTAAEALDIKFRHVFLKSRRRQKGSIQHERFSDQHYELTVQESGYSFLVNLSDYVDTGLFLDHRQTRTLVGEQAEGKRFLNLFAYTGTFSVYAAGGGASRTTSVDWSPTYLDWARRNLELNKMQGSEHCLVRQDAREFVNQLPREPLFDLAVVDPPTFSNSKRTEDDWDIQRDHAVLLNEVLARISPGGQLFFSTNFRRFKLDESSLRAATVREISRQTVPDDFRNRRIHRCWIMVR